MVFAPSPHPLPPEQERASLTASACSGVVYARMEPPQAKRPAQARRPLAGRIAAMRRVEEESWKRMVLRSMPKPAWLSDDAPHGDVVLSSRTRVMRNLRGRRFPNKADEAELMQVMQAILDAAREAQPALEVFRG